MDACIVIICGGAADWAEHDIIAIGCGAADRRATARRAAPFHALVGGRLQYISSSISALAKVTGDLKPCSTADPTVSQAKGYL